MAADSEERGQALQERNDSTTSTELQRLQQEICKDTLNDWRDSAAEFVRAAVFGKKQFITDEEIGIGGSVQKLVCAYINISGGAERARSFWEDKGGKETVRNTFRRKRQAAQNAMKLVFRGK